MEDTGTSSGGVPLSETESSEPAHNAWKSSFISRHFQQPLSSLNDSGPFPLNEKLGEGGWGNVYRTELNGIPLALKLLHPFPTKQRDVYLNEIKILQKLSENHHHHIVQLVGSFELSGKFRSRIGLLIWPVAKCDLSNFLHYMDIVTEVKRRLPDPHKKVIELELNEEEKDAVNMVALTIPVDLQASYSIAILHQYADLRLWGIFGCLASAISYLHNEQRIRHKDLNPKQILLSSHGLWLSDFGLSRDISESSSSVTYNGERASIKYHAPERESKGQLPCSRSEDIFSLGCIYLEIMHRICGFTGPEMEEKLNPMEVWPWSFQANLQDIDKWFQEIVGKDVVEDDFLANLIKTMMIKDSEERPDIAAVLQTLLMFNFFVGGVYSFSTCCHLSEEELQRHVFDQHCENRALKMELKESSQSNHLKDARIRELEERVHGLEENISKLGGMSVGKDIEILDAGTRRGL